ncbi:MAG: hypothetical protein JRF53_16505 [Deltaproteobacteria bacterium]|nr:hypothetical protein [Deltaproteobacteria bacterium]
MITEEPDIDFGLISEHFTTCGDYTKEVILEELEYWRKTTDFLVLVSRNDGHVDGFLIGYRSRNSLWIAQVWRKAGTDIKSSREAFEKAKKWAIERGMTSMTGETKRNEMRAMERYGLREFSLIMKCEL